ncbi:PA14 domain-containing protein [Pontibacter toksunensis]|uniref:PA14 domain-containing protein n=1 Tax=Pontibacter toksunensis TaxID=1332631 RepID=A0ABW6BRH9_9BACT
MHISTRLFFVLFIWFGCISQLQAQSKSKVSLGKASEIKAAFEAKAKEKHAKGTHAKISQEVPGKPSLVLNLKSDKKEGLASLFFGEVDNVKNSNFHLKVEGKDVSGSIILRDQKKYYRYSSTADGSVFLVEEDIDDILCVGFLESTDDQSVTSGQISAAAVAVPSLESLPGAEAVVFLDFDGQTVENTLWNSNFNGGNPIVAAPSDMTLEKMVEAWKMMSEDYRPFAINVTTSEAVFKNAPANRRMRVIFTPTNYFLPGAGGVAYVGSFTWGGTSLGETPCWVWSTYGSSAGMAGAHEVGHTLHLSHDGRTSPSEEYYLGHQSWAPIMGAGDYRSMVQWSKGEYSYASNKEDDLSIITSRNGFTYRQDDHGNAINLATPLVIDGGGAVAAAKNHGVITTRTDVDVFSFNTSGGTVDLTVAPSAIHPNLDIALTLRNSSGAVVTTASPSTLAALLKQTLAAGTYYLEVDGVTGSSGANSDYASLGEYSITGTIPAGAIATNVSPVVNITSPASGTNFSTPASITISASASDSDGSVAKVEFFQGATKLGEDLTSPYAYTWSGVAAGSYQLTVKATDNAGAVTTSAAVSVSVSTSTSITCTASGTIQREQWNSVSGSSVADIPLSSTPSSTSQLNLFEAPSGLGTSYGARVRGYICPPATGYYTFFIAADDNAELWLSTTDSPANKVKIASVTGWTSSRQWDKYSSQKSVSIRLEAGKKYYIEALHKQGWGGDNLAVAWQMPDGKMEAPIAGSRLSPYSGGTTTTPANQAPTANAGPDKTITSPSNSVILSGSGSDSDGSISSYSWTKVSGPSATLSGASTVSLTANNLLEGTYVFRLTVKDNGGLTASDDATVTVQSTTSITCTASGTIQREQWNSVSGSSISDIPLSKSPSSTSQLSLFEAPSGLGSNYGARVRGFICPPTTGYYTFFIAGDDNAELWLSTTDSPSNKEKIASVAGWTYSRQWNKYSSQKSAAVRLEAGKRYYIEALHKQGWGGDNLAVAWQMPDGKFEAPIAGSRLSPYLSSQSTAALTKSEIELKHDTPLASYYPNPFQEEITLQLHGNSDEKFSLEMYDITGREVWHLKDVQANQKLTIGKDLVTGVYILHVSTGKEAKQFRIVKAR